MWRARPPRDHCENFGAPGAGDRAESVPRVLAAFGFLVGRIFARENTRTAPPPGVTRSLNMFLLVTIIANTTVVCSCRYKKSVLE